MEVTQKTLNIQRLMLAARGAHAPRVLAVAPSRSQTFLRQNVSARRRNEHARARALPEMYAFTLIELLVVISIIIVLMGLLFPAFRGVQDQAKKTQAKNDLTQIVTAVNAYYTEYGKYPLAAASETTLGPGGAPTTNDTLFKALRGLDTTLNPRQIVFISAPDVKDKANPRSGIGIDPSNAGQFFDPWGKNYAIRIDGDYDNQVANPYSQNAGATPNLQIGVIAWSLGKDGTGGSGSADKNAATAADDVISWQ